MVCKWFCNGVFVFVFVMFVMGIVGMLMGSLVFVVYVWEVVLVDVVVSGFDMILIVSFLCEVVIMLSLIVVGGFYLYEKDGVVFGNCEWILLKVKCGYYYEYMVLMLCVCNCGVCWIVCGGLLCWIDNCYYMGDYYNSFKCIVE